MASGTGLTDLATGDWCWELVDLIGVDRSTLSPIVERDRPIALRKPLADRWPSLATATWFPPLGDGACATIGCGVTDNTRVAMTLGTSGAVRVPLVRPVGSPVPMAADLWAYRLDRATAIYGAAISNGGLALDWVREVLDADDETIAQAEELEPGAHGMTVLPFIVGERAPIWNDRARGVIAGMSAATGRADILRAVMEAIALRLATIYDRVTPIVSSDHAIVANGGALLKSAALQQIAADAIGRPLFALDPSLEASARGAALLALQTAQRSVAISLDPMTVARRVEPDQSLAVRYRRERARQDRLLDLLYPNASSWDQ
jgi:gluconokinase